MRSSCLCYMASSVHKLQEVSLRATKYAATGASMRRTKLAMLALVLDALRDPADAGGAAPAPGVAPLRAKAPPANVIPAPQGPASASGPASRPAKAAPAWVNLSPRAPVVAPTASPRDTQDLYHELRNSVLDR